MVAIDMEGLNNYIEESLAKYKEELEAKYDDPTVIEEELAKYKEELEEEKAIVKEAVDNIMKEVDASLEGSQEEIVPSKTIYYCGSKSRYKEGEDTRDKIKDIAGELCRLLDNLESKDFDLELLRKMLQDLCDADFIFRVKEEN